MKARIKKTGEIVDIICIGGSPLNRNDALDYVNYIDSQGVKHTELNHLNYYWDFEPIEENTINNEHWQDVKEHVAIAAMQGLLADPTRHDSWTDYAKDAVDLANALIEELKKQLKEN